MAPSRDSSSSRSKKRKPTYLVRKEQVRELEKRVRALRDELAALQDAKDHANTDLTEAKNQVLKEVVRRQQLALASAHAMIYSHLSSQQENPMYTHIHLPRQCRERRQTLLRMKDDKFRQCHNYLAERCRHLDMAKDHSTIDQFEDADGNFICHRFDVIHIRGARSLHEVYEALTFFMFNMEISVSETLGDITVREDFDSLHDGGYMSNHRFVSSHDGGTSEVNTALFAQWFDDGNDLEGAACALVATDSIDEDDVHPYESLSHVRRDVTASIALTEEFSRDATSPGSRDLNDADDEVVVVMRRAAFMKLYRPSFDVPEEVLLNMRDRIAQWPNVMLQTMRDMIDGRIVRE
jgi:hypothetical protein